MTQQATPYSIAQFLLQHELFVFRSRVISDLFGLNKYQTARLLRRMERNGLVATVERGKYLLLGLTPEKIFSNPLYIGVNLISPAYISFWSALHFHGLTEQAPRMVFVATTGRKPEMAFRGIQYKFVGLKPDAFFGYRRELLDGLPVLIADEAKAILDSLTFPEYAGGITEAAKAIQIAIFGQSLDVNELIEYAVRLKNGSLASRLGYLLELLHQPVDGLQPASGPVLLDPRQSERGIFHRHWKLYVNMPTEDLFPQGIA
jgi:predicted transcriptional regulator of viral defense system